MTPGHDEPGDEVYDRLEDIDGRLASIERTLLLVLVGVGFSVVVSMLLLWR